MTAKGRGELKSGFLSRRVRVTAKHALWKVVSSAGRLEKVGELEEILNLPARAGLISWRV